MTHSEKVDNLKLWITKAELIGLAGIDALTLDVDKLALIKNNISSISELRLPPIEVLAPGSLARMYVTNLILPENLKYIGYEALQGMMSYELYLPENIEHIGGKAFVNRAGKITGIQDLKHLKFVGLDTFADRLDYNIIKNARLGIYGSEQPGWQLAEKNQLELEKMYNRLNDDSLLFVDNFENLKEHINRRQELASTQCKEAANKLNRILIEYLRILRFILETSNMSLSILEINNDNSGEFSIIYELDIKNGIFTHLATDLQK